MFANTAEALTRLTKANVEWTWETKKQQAFDELKRKLTEALILQQADQKDNTTSVSNSVAMRWELL